MNVPKPIDKPFIEKLFFSTIKMAIKKRVPIKKVNPIITRMARMYLTNLELNNSVRCFAKSFLQE